MLTLERISKDNIDEASEIQLELFPGFGGRGNYEDSLAENSGYEYYLVLDDGVRLTAPSD